MYSNNSNGSCAAWARGFVALFAIMLSMGLALAASPAEAAPFAYVTNPHSNSISVIDTATNTVAGFPLPVGSIPGGVAVTPDGKRVYVTTISSNPGTVLMINTATNTGGFPPLPVGSIPGGVAVTPDGAQLTRDVLPGLGYMPG